jgi:molybdopterin/thiamine biosynthesis adenylyltransferase
MEAINAMKWSNFYKEMINRNIGVISVKEQERLRKTCIAVAGCGGMGGLSAEQLVRLGVGRLKIADFDSFQTHNLSRQCGSLSSNIGQNKAEVLTRHFKEINPELRLEVFKNGIQPENVEKFVEGAEAVIDAIDYTCFYNTVILNRAARRRNLCVINAHAIGFGVNIFVFGPGTVSIEEYAGLPSDTSRTEIESFKIPIEKFAPYMPTYINPGDARKVAQEGTNIPNIIMPQHLGTAIAVSEAVMIALGRVKPPVGPDPRIFILDLQDRKFEVTG